MLIFTLIVAISAAMRNNDGRIYAETSYRYRDENGQLVILDKSRTYNQAYLANDVNYLTHVESTCDHSKLLARSNSVQNSKTGYSGISNRPYESTEYAVPYAQNNGIIRRTSMSGEFPGIEELEQQNLQTRNHVYVGRAGSLFSKPLTVPTNSSAIRREIRVIRCEICGNTFQLNQQLCTQQSTSKDLRRSSMVSSSTVGYSHPIDSVEQPHMTQGSNSQQQFIKRADSIRSDKPGNDIINECVYNNKNNQEISKRRILRSRSERNARSQQSCINMIGSVQNCKSSLGNKTSLQTGHSERKFWDLQENSSPRSLDPRLNWDQNTNRHKAQTLEAVRGYFDRNKNVNDQNHGRVAGINLPRYNSTMRKTISKFDTIKESPQHESNMMNTRNGKHMKQYLQNNNPQLTVRHITPEHVYEFVNGSNLNTISSTHTNMQMQNQEQLNEVDFSKTKDLMNHAYKKHILDRKIFNNCTLYTIIKNNLIFFDTLHRESVIFKDIIKQVSYVSQNRKKAFYAYKFNLKDNEDTLAKFYRAKTQPEQYNTRNSTQTRNRSIENGKHTLNENRTNSDRAFDIYFALKIDILQQKSDSFIILITTENKPFEFNATTNIYKTRDGHDVNINYRITNEYVSNNKKIESCKFKKTDTQILENFLDLSKFLVYNHSTNIAETDIKLKITNEFKWVPVFLWIFNTNDSGAGLFLHGNNKILCDYLLPKLNRAYKINLNNELIQHSDVLDDIKVAISIMDSLTNKISSYKNQNISETTSEKLIEFVFSIKQKCTEYIKEKDKVTRINKFLEMHDYLAKFINKYKGNAELLEIITSMLEKYKVFAFVDYIFLDESDYKLADRKFRDSDLITSTLNFIDIKTTSKTVTNVNADTSEISNLYIKELLHKNRTVKTSTITFELLNDLMIKCRIIKHHIKSYNIEQGKMRNYRINAYEMLNIACKTYKNEDEDVKNKKKITVYKIAFFLHIMEKGKKHKKLTDNLFKLIKEMSYKANKESTMTLFEQILYKNDDVFFDCTAMLQNLKDFLINNYGDWYGKLLFESYKESGCGKTNLDDCFNLLERVETMY